MSCSPVNGWTSSRRCGGLRPPRAPLASQPTAPGSAHAANVSFLRNRYAPPFRRVEHFPTRVRTRVHSPTGQTRRVVSRTRFEWNAYRDTFSMLPGRPNHKRSVDPQVRRPTTRRRPKGAQSNLRRTTRGCPLLSDSTPTARLPVADERSSRTFQGHRIWAIHRPSRA